MSAATQLSLAAMSASGARAVAHVQLDGEGTEDLYAVWRSVFERARAVELPRDSRVDGHAGDASTGSVNGTHDYARPPALLWMHRPTIGQVGAAPFTSNAWTNTVANAAVDPSAAAKQSMTAQRGVHGTTVVVATQIPESRDPDVAPSRDRPVADDSAPDDPGAPQSGTNVAAKSAAARTQPALAELVNVFVRGTAVTIVVRDVELSAEDALHCAFETARELTGQRAALQQLTLNGRTVYQHSDAGASGSVHGFEQPASVLVFAC